mmetsp:Transcript_29138/g.28204  ORF Transcript_29138/g.28204 Transcript_29138/m.28204 type:complete len:112 (+) Transcript_29138:1276-1611(+)
MDAPTTEIDPITGGVKISWVPPITTNGEPLTGYLIEILEFGTSNWHEDATNCLGSSSTIISQEFCIIPMSVLTTTPYDYTFDELVEVRVSAENNEGYGPASATNTVGANIR